MSGSLSVFLWSSLEWQLCHDCGGERDACSRSVSKRSWDELHWKRHPGGRGQSSLVDAPNDTCCEDCCGQGEIFLTLQARLLSQVRRGDLRGVRIMQRAVDVNLLFLLSNCEQ